jgi:hypothetical protein
MYFTGIIRGEVLRRTSGQPAASHFVRPPEEYVHTDGNDRGNEDRGSLPGTEAETFHRFQERLLRIYR